jgi:hypothetical protein
MLGWPRTGQLLFPEYESAHLVAQLLDLFGIGGAAKALCQIEESFFFLAPRFESLLDQFDKHVVVAKPPLLCHALYLLGQSCGKCKASAHFAGSCHGTIVHQNGAQMHHALPEGVSS